MNIIKKWFGHRTFIGYIIPSAELASTEVDGSPRMMIVPGDNLKGRLACEMTSVVGKDVVLTEDVFEIVRTEIPPIIGGEATIVIKPFGSKDPVLQLTMLFEPFSKRFCLIKETGWSKFLHFGMPLKKEQPKRD